MPRFVCVWFPDWSLQRLLDVQPELKGRPIVLYADVPRYGLRVVQASKAAIRMGVQPGLPLAEAQTIFDRPQNQQRNLPQIALHDPAADREFLEGIAEHCQRYAPLVGIDDFGPSDTLTLNITGCAEHFGGEASLARQMLRDLARFILRVGIADTIGTAWGVARFGGLQPVTRSSLEIVPAGKHQEALATCSIRALRLPDDVIESLQELGLQTVSQVLALPRQSLPSRFGKILVQRLDQALGTIPEIIVPIRGIQAIEVGWSFETAVSDRHILESALRQLLEQLLETLKTQQAGLQQLQIQIFCAGGAMCPVSLGSLRPSTSLEHWQDLLRLQLERLTLPAEVLRLHLQAMTTARLDVRSQELFEDIERNSEQHLWQLLDRLSNRLGSHAVLRPELRPDTQPEFSYRFVPLAGSHFSSRPPDEITAKTSDNSIALTRPLLLKRKPIPLAVTSVVAEGPPIRFEWEGEFHTVARLWGPERIETGWWRGPHVGRDYYRVETAQGRRFWLFRELMNGEWFLHGVFE